MDLTRRKFLTLVGGSAAGAVLFQACGVPEAELIVESPVQMPEDMVTGIDNWYATLCPNCTSQEGIVVRVMEGRAKKVEGNVDYPVNQGKHGVRCEAAVQGLYHPDRISAPLVRLGARGEGRWEEISWTDAIARLANSLGQIEDRASVVLATEPVGGHLGKVVERFASRTGVRHMPYETLDETNLRTSMKQVYGLDDMPDFDIGSASYLLTFGADFLSTWGSPVRYARAYGQLPPGRPRSRDARPRRAAALDHGGQRRRVGLRQPRLGGPRRPLDCQRDSRRRARRLRSGGGPDRQWFGRPLSVCPGADSRQGGRERRENTSDRRGLRGPSAGARDRRRLCRCPLQRAGQSERHILAQPSGGQRGQVGRRHPESRIPRSGCDGKPRCVSLQGVAGARRRDERGERECPAGPPRQPRLRDAGRGWVQAGPPRA